MSYTIKGAPFRYGKSVNVEDCTTSEEVMIKAGLNWDVTKCELYGKMPGLIEDANKDLGFLYGGDYFAECPNSYGVYRTDHNILLGNVKERYTPVQNIEAFKFFDNAIGKNKAIWQTAGCFGIGQKVFVSAKLPKNIMIDGKDPIENYLVFMTSHDGSMGVRVLLTPIRIVCQNTLSAAWKHKTNYVSFRHTASVHDNIDQAANILGVTEKMIDYTSNMYNKMNKTKVTDKVALESFANIILTDNEFDNIKNTGHTLDNLVVRNWKAIQETGISMRKVNMLQAMNNYYYTGPGQKETIGTAWGVYGAITGYYSNVDNAVGEKRMDSLLFGDKSRKLDTANELLLNI